jgi:transposase
VLEEAGLAPPSYATLKRRLPVYAKEAWRQRLSAACAAHAGLGRASLVLYDVSTLYFETDAGDGFREPGFSKERRLDPQITIGLLTDQRGFPLMVSAFEGNKAETKTMLPVIEAFMAAHQLPDVTVVADAGMVSEANQKEIAATSASVTGRTSRAGNYSAGQDEANTSWLRPGDRGNVSRTSEVEGV